MIKLILLHLKDCLLLLKLILVYRSVCKIRAYLKDDNFKAKLASYYRICSENECLQPCSFHLIA